MGVARAVLLIALAAIAYVVLHAMAIL